MVDSITFRTDDVTRWGPGLGADLSASMIDINFWVLFTAVSALQDHQDTSAAIDHFVVNTNNLYVYLTNHLVLGPYTLPTSQWNFRGGWQPLTNYALFDVFTEDGAVYLVIFAHRSNSDFSPFSNDGFMHNYYATLLAAPPSELPNDGVPGQVLTWGTASVPSYANPGGTGNRTSLITVTTTATLFGSSGTPDRLVDGNKANDSASAIGTTLSQSGAISFTFDFGAGVRKLITEAKWYQNGPSAFPGVWKWRGSDDGVNWLDLCAVFTLNGGSAGAAIGNLSNNLIGYRYHQLLQTTNAGGNDSPWLWEIEFKLDDFTETVRWNTPTRNVGFYMETVPDPLDVIFRWPFTEVTTFLTGLPGSQATHFTPPTGLQDYQIYHAGSNIGTIHFHPSPAVATFTFPADVTFTPGEVMTIVGPAIPDPHMTGIAVALVGALSA